MSCQYGKALKKRLEGGSRGYQGKKKSSSEMCPFVPDAGKSQAAKGSCP